MRERGAGLGAPKAESIGCRQDCGRQKFRVCKPNGASFRALNGYDQFSVFGFLFPVFHFLSLLLKIFPVRG